jgi:hypothetical protein
VKELRGRLLELVQAKERLSPIPADGVDEFDEPEARREEEQGLRHLSAQFCSRAHERAGMVSLRSSTVARAGTS